MSRYQNDAWTNKHYRIKHEDIQNDHWTEVELRIENRDFTEPESNESWIMNQATTMSLNEETALRERLRMNKEWPCYRQISAWEWWQRTRSSIDNENRWPENNSSKNRTLLPISNSLHLNDVIVSKSDRCEQTNGIENKLSPRYDKLNNEKFSIKLSPPIRQEALRTIERITQSSRTISTMIKVLIDVRYNDKNDKSNTWSDKNDDSRLEMMKNVFLLNVDTCMQICTTWFHSLSAASRKLVISEMIWRLFKEQISERREEDSGSTYLYYDAKKALSWLPRKASGKAGK